MSSTTFDAIKIGIASPEMIKEWSYGEVKKPETINYRTLKPERDGLFCEKIFGPTKDINPHDSKLKGVRSREAAVDKEGNLVTKSISRRERMGHIALAAPVAHIWFMRGVPSALSLLLDIGSASVKEVCYFTGVTVAVVSALAKKGFVEIFDSEVYRKPKITAEKKITPIPPLTENQQKAFDVLEKTIKITS